MDPQSVDHDLLIELRTEVKGLRGDVRDLSSNTSDRITKLEATKLDKEAYFLSENERTRTVDDHERRLRNNERVLYLGMGALAVLQIALQYLKK